MGEPRHPHTAGAREDLTGLSGDRRPRLFKVYLVFFSAKGGAGRGGAGRPAVPLGCQKTTGSVFPRLAGGSCQFLGW